MKSKKLVLCVFTVFCILTSTVNYAYGSIISLSSWDLVDSGKHCDWGGSSQYLSLFAGGITKWEAYKPGIIRKDTIGTISDLCVRDTFIVNDENATTSSNGQLFFNTYNMDNLNVFHQAMVATHEMGHALGLGHNEAGNIMYLFDTAQCELGVYDKTSYDAAYLKY
jgi:hypothetical protein